MAARRHQQSGAVRIGEDIEPGSRWQAEIAGELEASSYGIVCVTRDNQAAPWLNFEAGALAKAVDASRVVPLAIDLKPSDIEPPLGTSRPSRLHGRAFFEIVRAVNAACERSLDNELLETSFQKWWPDLAGQIEAIGQATPAPAGDTRTERELLEETLDIVRGLARASAGRPAAATPVKTVEQEPRASDHKFDRSRVSSSPRASSSHGTQRTRPRKHRKPVAPRARRGANLPS